MIIWQMKLLAIVAALLLALAPDAAWSSPGFGLIKRLFEAATMRLEPNARAYCLGPFASSLQPRNIPGTLQSVHISPSDASAPFAACIGVLGRAVALSNVRMDEAKRHNLTLDVPASAILMQLLETGQSHAVREFYTGVVVARATAGAGCELDYAPVTRLLAKVLTSTAVETYWRLEAVGWIDAPLFALGTLGRRILARPGDCSGAQVVDRWWSDGDYRQCVLDADEEFQVVARPEDFLKSQAARFARRDYVCAVARLAPQVASSWHFGALAQLQEFVMLRSGVGAADRTIRRMLQPEHATRELAFALLAANAMLLCRVDTTKEIEQVALVLPRTVGCLEPVLFSASGNPRKELLFVFQEYLSALARAFGRARPEVGSWAAADVAWSAVVLFAAQLSAQNGVIARLRTSVKARVRHKLLQQPERPMSRRERQPLSVPHKHRAIANAITRIFTTVLADSPRLREISVSPLPFDAPPAGAVRWGHELGVQLQLAGVSAVCLA